MLRSIMAMLMLAMRMMILMIVMMMMLLMALPNSCPPWWQVARPSAS